MDRPNVNWFEFDAAKYWPIWLRRCVQQNGCWLWQGYCVKGYPQTHVNKKARLIHRLAFMSVYGPIPEGKELDHICDKPRCINPFHLRAVTARENSLRAKGNACAVNFTKPTCKRGHQFDGVDRRGYRNCSLCRRAAAQRWRRKRSIERGSRLYKLRVDLSKHTPDLPALW